MNRRISPSTRAADIADREAQIVWQTTRDFNKYMKCWLETYEQVLREFASIRADIN